MYIEPDRNGTLKIFDNDNLPLKDVHGLRIHMIDDLHLLPAKARDVEQDLKTMWDSAGARGAQKFGIGVSVDFKSSGYVPIPVTHVIAISQELHSSKEAALQSLLGRVVLQPTPLFDPIIHQNTKAAVGVENADRNRAFLHEKLGL